MWHANQEYTLTIWKEQPVFLSPQLPLAYQELIENTEKYEVKNTAWPSFCCCLSFTPFPVCVGLPLAQESLLALGSPETPKWSLQEEEENWLLRAGARHTQFFFGGGGSRFSKKEKSTRAMGYFTVQVKLCEKSFGYPYIVYRCFWNMPDRYIWNEIAQENLCQLHPYQPSSPGSGRQRVIVQMPVDMFAENTDRSSHLT